MPRLALRSRKRRKSSVRVASGSIVRFKDKKPSKAKCGVTGDELHGIPRYTANEAKNVPKTYKRPERPYGGSLSSRAMRAKFKRDALLYDEKNGSKSTATLKFMEPGRMCVKIAGRDAGLKCVVVDVIDKQHVIVDGQTRRRKCNVKHLEPLNLSLKLKKGASHADVKKEFTKLKIDIKETKPKKASPRPKKAKVQKTKVKKAEPVKKEPKKTETKKETTEKKAKKKETKPKTTKKSTAKKTKK